MKKSVVALFVVVLLSATSAFAIDRNARMIDWAQLDLLSLDDADGVGGSIWGETALVDTDWAVLAGIGLGTVSPDVAENTDYWLLGIGLKYYLTDLTGISLIGHYTWFDNDADTDIKAATASVKQRLIPASEPVSPFLVGHITYRDRSTFSDSETSDDSISEVVFQLGAGCEFAASETFSFEFEGAYAIADSSEDDAEDLDGWVGRIAMRYYWFTAD